MRISRNKKILVTAITVFSISAIGISINALTGAFSLDSMSRDEKYMTDTFIARAGDEKIYEDEFEDEYENEFEDEASIENQEEEELSEIDAVTSATLDSEVPGGEYTAGEEVLANQGDIAFDIESSATPKTGSAAAVTGIKPAPIDPAALVIVPSPGVDIVSSATPKEPSSGSPSSSPDSSDDLSAGINSDAAKQIFLEKVPGASITEFELDEDDGILIYEIEAYIGQNKYEFKLDANTGAILSYQEAITDTEDAAEPDDDDDYDNDYDDDDDDYDDDDYDDSDDDDSDDDDNDD